MNGQPENRRPATEPTTIPVVAVREPDNGRKQIKRLTNRRRDHKKQRSLPSNEKTTTGRDPIPNQGIGKSVPRSPVSTGRLHPSRDFHLRPIEHVFNMRATNAPRSVKES